MLDTRMKWKLFLALLCAKYFLQRRRLRKDKLIILLSMQLTSHGLEEVSDTKHFPWEVLRNTFFFRISSFQYL